MPDDLDRIARRFANIAPGNPWTLRLVRESSEYIALRQDLVQPLQLTLSEGALLQVECDGGCGYAATGDLSPAGLTAAWEEARRWAQLAASWGLPEIAPLPQPAADAELTDLPGEPWTACSLADKLELLHAASAALHCHPRILEWRASVLYTRSETLLLGSEGHQVHQCTQRVEPHLVAVANAGNQTQTRTSGMATGAGQGGLELLRAAVTPRRARILAEEALALLDAPECPDGRLDLLLLPSQMALQIHESIGHPLELDRILGDERNYAGTSFVTSEMFGHYRYGSELLNVSFDPRRPGELASYAYDDDGSPARHRYLIRNGILERPLGGALSQRRSGLPGTANSRASAWNRPPIDRMANINLEPGDSPFETLVGQIEHGVLMETNRSWSIDDSRNKFQFGCELGRLIVDGELRGLVRNPGYRGISARFWRNLSAVGDAASFELLGVTSCGKGEPNQLITVGHGAPACLFRDVEVFGGGGR